MVQPDTITISKENEVYMKVDCEPSITQELIDFFTFQVPNYKFMPSYRQKKWDGKIRLFKRIKGIYGYYNGTYGGLYNKMIDFAESRKYGILGGDDYRVINNPKTKEIIGHFVDSLDIHLDDEKITIRPYQYMAIHEALINKRCILVSPTGSGKSLMIYCLIRSYQQNSNKKILVVVPTTSLVEQMFKDFDDYASVVSWNSEDNCHRIYAGADRETEKPIIISTWQSIFRLGQPFFEQFGMVVGDEAHGFKATSLIGIMEKLVNCEYRIGTTGTLPDDSNINLLSLEGLFGKVHETTSSRELMDKKILAQLNIHCIQIQHSDADRKIVSKLEFQDEIKFIVTMPERNQYIAQFVNSECTGNTLILYTRVEQHGKVLYDMIPQYTNKNVFLIHGGVDALEREMVRETVEKSNDNIVIASYGTFSQGVNIKNLHNVVFASPHKSRIRNLQSIGRGLRTTEDKSDVNLYDIADDFRTNNKDNYTWNHFLGRLNIYEEQEFNYTFKVVDWNE